MYLLFLEINNFKNEIFDMRQIEIDNLDRLRSKQLSEIQQKNIELQRHSLESDSFNNLVLENTDMRKVQENIRKQIDRKYTITIDFALIAAVSMIKKIY